MCRYWTVALSGAKVGGQAVTLEATTAIMDSGTTAILVSAVDASAIHAVGGFRRSCSSFCRCWWLLLGTGEQCQTSLSVSK